MDKVITSKDILDTVVHIYFEKNCTTKEAIDEARKRLNISDEDLRKVLIV
jgi:hypothetical protein